MKAEKEERARVGEVRSLEMSVHSLTHTHTHTLSPSHPASLLGEQVAVKIIEKQKLDEIAKQHLFQEVVRDRRHSSCSVVQVCVLWEGWRERERGSVCVCVCEE